MLSEPRREYLGQAIKTIQIIALALISGVIIFSLIVLLLSKEDQEPVETPILAYIGAVLGLIAVVTAPVLSRVFSMSMRQAVVEGTQVKPGGPKPNPESEGDVSSLVAVYQFQQLVSRAILEGAAFLNLIAYMTESQSMSLVFAVLLLITMFFRFPTPGNLESWVTEELATVEQLRSLEESERQLEDSGEQT